MKIINAGKKFEARFKLDWKRCFPKEFIYRLPDQMSGKYGSTNPCDFFAIGNKRFYLIECKAHEGKSINWAQISQVETLINYQKEFPDILAGVVIWFYECDQVIFVSARTCAQMISEGEASIGLRMLKSDYKKQYQIIVIPSKKLKVYLESDYTILTTIQEKEDIS